MTTDTQDLIDDYDWREVFTYADFSIDDIKTLKSAISGGNDGADWRIWGILKNGKYFYVTAWCDYTGWACQASGTSYTADTEEELIKMHMDFGARQAFGIAQPEV